MNFPRAASLAFAAALAASCGREDPPRAAAPVAPSARESDDAAQAIETFIAAGRTREAELVARRLLEKSPAGTPGAAKADELAARALFARAELAAAELNPSERAALLAEAAACAARAAGAGSPDAVRLRFAALLAARTGDHAAATALYDRALAAAPDDLQSLLDAAMSAVAAKDLARAKMLLERRVARAPDDAWSFGLAASVALAESRADDAAAAAREALRQDGDVLEFRLLLARALRAQRKPDEAARMLSALDDAARARPAIAEQHARALEESGDLAGAARAWELSRRANPADPFVRAETAIAFHRAGDTARAAAELAELRALPGAADHAARAEASIAPR
ncbi:MAG: tetratricopeptide repeat protein [Planctomycetota bacterium]